MDMMVLEEEEHGEVRLVQGVIRTASFTHQSRFLEDSKLQAPCRADALTTKDSLVPESTEGVAQGGR